MYFLLGLLFFFVEKKSIGNVHSQDWEFYAVTFLSFSSIFIPWVHLQSHLEVKNKKILIIGCGKLGQKVGLLAKEMPLDLIGFKRKKITSPNIKYLEQDIFDKSFFDQVKNISPHFILYCLSADSHQKRVTKKTMSKV